MPEPLITSQQMVGEWDPDLGGWSARDWAPGPAGTVGLTLPGDVELEIDVAAPGVFVGLWVDASGGDRPSDASLETVRALLGDERTRQLLGISGEPQVRPLAGGPVRPRRRERGTQPGPEEPGVNPVLGRLGLATDVMEAPASSELARGLAAIETAVAASQIALPDMRTRARDTARLGAAIVLDHHSELDRVDPWALTEALYRLRDLVPDRTARRLDSVITSLREGGPYGVEAASQALPSMAEPDAAALRMPGPRRSPVGRLLDLDRLTLPAELQTAGMAVRQTRDAEAEVRIADGAADADQWWARAFGSDGSVLAAAPFLAVDDDAVARLLIPPAALRTATYDITDRPGELRLPDRMRAVTEAIHHGRAAARAERLDDTKTHFSRWGLSSSDWRTAGDQTRSRQALQYAEDGGRFRDNRVPPALLSDAVTER